jgi:hypothetical protein
MLRLLGTRSHSGAEDYSRVSQAQLTRHHGCRFANRSVRGRSEEVRDRVLEAAEYTRRNNLVPLTIAASPLSDDTSTARETAFAKIRPAFKVLRSPKGSAKTLMARYASVWP